MASTRDLESQAETDRSQIAATLDELRSRMSPGQLVDQAISYARGHGGSEFVHNLGDQVKANPLPLALVAAGLGWLMAGPRRPAPRAYSPCIVPDETHYDERVTDKARETSAEVAGALRDSTKAPPNALGAPSPEPATAPSTRPRPRLTLWPPRAIAPRTPPPRPAIHGPPLIARRPAPSVGPRPR